MYKRLLWNGSKFDKSQDKVVFRKKSNTGTSLHFYAISVKSWVCNLYVCQGRAIQGIFKNMYHNDPKFSDRYAWANSEDPDQTAPRGAV